MLLELTSEETKYLDQVLERHLTGLIREISHCDSQEFKQGLRSEVDFLNALQTKLRERPMDRPGSGGREEFVNPL